MIAASIPMGRIDPPIPVADGGQVVLIDRRHRAPKGKVLVGWHRPGGGVGMTTLDDTDRLETTR